MYKINSKVDKPDINYMQQRIFEMMRRGIKVGNIESRYNEYKGLQDKIGDDINNNYGIANVNSPKQIVSYMQSLESAEVYEVCCNDGKWTSNKEALKNLELLGYKFAKDIMNFRKAKKYAEACKSLLDAMDENRLVHPEVSFGKTNRVNYKGPALMNIPKELLWHLITPSETGNLLFTADIKNQEPSILINLLGAEEFKDALTDPRGLYEALFSKPFEFKAKLNVWVVPPNSDRNGVWTSVQMAEKQTIPPIYYSPYKPLTDSFFVNGLKVLGIDSCNTVTDLGKEPVYPNKVTVYLEGGNSLKMDVTFDKIDKKLLNKVGVYELTGTIKGVDLECTGIVRKEFKTAWNAMTYGASEYGIKRMCKHIDGKSIYRYFSKIKEFKKYRQQCTKLANKGIQTIRTFFGTELYANEYNPKVLRRVLMDLPIQGTGTDILALLIKHFDEEIEVRGLQGKLWIYYTRHDELIIEASKEYVEEVGIEHIKEVINDILEHQIDDWVPFKLGVDVIKAEEVAGIDSLILEDYDD